MPACACYLPGSRHDQGAGNAFWLVVSGFRAHAPRRLHAAEQETFGRRLGEDLIRLPVLAQKNDSTGIPSIENTLTQDTVCVVQGRPRLL